MARQRSGSIDRRPSGRYRARHRGDSKTFDSRADAAAWIDSRGPRSATGRRPTVTLADLGPEWIEECESLGRTPETLSGYRSALNAVLAVYGGLQAATIGAGELRRIVQELAASGLSASTQRNRLNVVTALVRYAQGMEYIEARPLPVKRPTVPLQSHVETYSPDEVGRILAAALEAGPRQYAAVRFGIDAGLRAGEIMRVRMGSLNWKRLVLTVPSRAVRGEQTKSGRGRSLPVPSSLVDAVRDLRPLDESKRIICPGDWTATSRFLKWIRPVWHRAGFDAVLVHSLRHFWASRLANAPTPASPYQLRSWGGWSDLRMVLRYYHEPEQISRESVDSLPDVS